MDPDQFADGRSLIRAHRACSMIKLTEVQSNVNMHMHFQYIKYWLDKGFNKLDIYDK